MYSGTTLTPLSGNILGTHQKIDRLSRGLLIPLLKNNQNFPGSRQILHFEGNRGPDAIKRKSPAQDEPWHYYAPFEEGDTALLDIIGDHYDKLTHALKHKDQVRASFEAAWLAHAIVDGLTPAHHFPYEEKLSELRGGQGLETRDTYKGKLIMPGKTRLQQLKNNWNMWGAKGLFTAHVGFEWGMATVFAPITKRRVSLKSQEIAELHKYGVLGLFRRKAKEIAALGLYEQYMARGWTPRLAKISRRKVAPAIVHMVTLAWYAAAIDAGIARKPRP